MEAGADAVEIHMAHGYLVSTFLSPRTNKRVDEFGGCFENRMRFSRLIIEEVKKATQGKIAVLARINCADEVPGGLDVHDSAAIAAYLESCGIEVLNTKGLGLLYDKDMDATPLEKIYELAKSVDVPEADAVLILCTGVRSVPIIEMLEKDLKKPVISAIQASMWYSLKTLGIDTNEVKGFGSLFEK